MKHTSLHINHRNIDFYAALNHQNAPLPLIKFDHQALLWFVLFVMIPLI
jgi:hypothetical protein